MSYLVWPNGRDPSRLWHRVLGPSLGNPCGKSSPDGTHMCFRNRDHETSKEFNRDLHLAFALHGGQMENDAEWFDGDKAPPSYYDRDDMFLPASAVPPAQPQASVLGKKIAAALIGPASTAVPADPPTLTSKDRTATFYGEVYELDLIPDATDEDYKTLPTWEALNKGK